MSSEIIREVVNMNHDYAHCIDYSPDCPKNCFRAKLERDLAEHPIWWRGLSYMHFKGTKECKREESKDDNRSIKRNRRGSSKDGYEH